MNFFPLRSSIKLYHSTHTDKTQMLQFAKFLLQLIKPCRSSIAIISILKILSGFVSQYAILNVMDQSNNSLYIIGFSFCFQWMVSCLSEALIFGAARSISDAIISSETKRYGCLDAPSRTKFSAISFNSSMSEMVMRISNTAINGIFQLNSAIESFIVCIGLFILKGYFAYILVIALVHFLWNFFVAKKFLLQWKLARDSYRDFNLKNTSAIQLLLTNLQQQGAGSDRIIEKYCENNKQSYIQDLAYTKFNSCGEISGKIMALLFVLYWHYISQSSVAEFIVLFNLIQQVNGNISSLMDVYMQFSRTESSYIKYQKEWEDLTSNPQVEQEPFPVTGLTYSKVDISRGNFKLETSNLTIRPKETVIIRGKSGQGKSTLITALVGDSVGAEMSNGKKSAAYHDCFSVACQNCYFPSSGVTIRTWLDSNVSADDEPVVWSFLKDLKMDKWLKERKLDEKSNNEKIDSRMTPYRNNYPIIQAVLDLWSLKITASKMPSSLDSIKIEIPTSMKSELTLQMIPSVDVSIHPFDMVLSGVSGGETKRLVTLKSLYQAYKSKAKCIVLDEPEAGIDPVDAGEILQELLQNDIMKDMSKLIITHLCECQLGKIKQNRRWIVGEGKIIH